jgi:glucosamine--fructose-6-phosphate aminotransferase (isomerizing)
MSQMLKEVRETPARVAAMLGRDQDAYDALKAALDARPPAFAATIARGSSDHAASYGAWLIALSTGLATASLPPSLVSRYAARPRLEHALVLALSQSGASPDLVRSLEAATATGAITTAIVNQPGSPLAAAARHVLPQNAGEEKSVAATKSFILTCTALARLVATWQDDQALTQALHHLPERLEQATATDWGPTVELLKDATSLYVLGRGPTHAIAGEAALKLKETCYLHAEAFSTAEVQHGPKAVIDQDFPLLALATTDQGGADTLAYASEAAKAGITTITASPEITAPGHHIHLPEPLHPWLDPITTITAFYPLAEALARARGHDPDKPRGLKKVTSTT